MTLLGGTCSTPEAGTASPAFRFVPEIEALRGVAAFAVVVEHVFGGSTHGANKIVLLFFNGMAAVILFFVISGFALGTQIRNDSPSVQSYLAFVIRRLFRLMPAVWLSLLLGYPAAALWDVPYHNDPYEWLGNIFLYRFALNVPLWSLYVELWCSMVFPLLFWGYRRLGVPGKLVLFAGLLVLVVVPEPQGYPPILFIWWRYLFCFYLGLVAAEYGPRFVPRSLVVQAAIVLAIIVLAGSTRYWPQLWINAILLVPGFAYGVLVAIVLATAGTLLTAPLRWGPIRFVGRISFSLYVLHLPLMFLIHKPFWAVLPTAFSRIGFFGISIFLVAELAVSLPLAWLVFTYVEKPMNDLGRNLARAIQSPVVAKPAIPEVS